MRYGSGRDDTSWMGGTFEEGAAATEVVRLLREAWEERQADVPVLWDQPADVLPMEGEIRPEGPEEPGGPVASSAEGAAGELERGAGGGGARAEGEVPAVGQGQAGGAAQGPGVRVLRLHGGEDTPPAEVPGGAAGAGDKAHLGAETLPAAALRHRKPKWYHPGGRGTWCRWRPWTCVPGLEW